MIRKLLAGTSVLAIAVVAVMLLGIGSSSKSAEAVVRGIALVGGSSIPVGTTNFDIEINADDNSGAAGSSEDGGDIYVQLSNGVAFGVECFYAFGFPCDYEEGTPTQAIVDCEGGVEDCDELNIELEIAPSFPGGSVQITACQNYDDGPSDFAFDHDDWPFIECAEGTAMTATFQVVGAVASIELFALRDFTNDGSINQCTGQEVHVIAALGYTDAAWLTSFNNDRAVLCALLLDSAGHPVPGEAIVWSDSGPGCVLDGAVTFSLNNGITHNRFAACDTGDSGEVSTVSACVASVCGSVEIEFGDDPASCSITVDPEILDIGDVATLTVIFVDEFGNKVPDGIIGSLNVVHSGESGANATLLNSPEDTVDSMFTGQVTTAIAGISTVSATLQGVGENDISCGEVLEFSGDVHQHPDVCPQDDDFILYGNIPPGGNFEWGTFAFCGGSWDKLLEVSECPEATAIFWYNTPAGGWESWVPGSDVAAANAAILARFPEHEGIPEGTIFTAACSAIDEA